MGWIGTCVKGSWIKEAWLSALIGFCSSADCIATWGLVFRELWSKTPAIVFVKWFIVGRNATRRVCCCSNRLLMNIDKSLEFSSLSFLFSRERMVFASVRDSTEASRFSTSFFLLSRLSLADRRLARTRSIFFSSSVCSRFLLDPATIVSGGAISTSGSVWLLALGCRFLILTFSTSVGGCLGACHVLCTEKKRKQWEYTLLLFLWSKKWDFDFWCFGFSRTYNTRFILIQNVAYYEEVEIDYLFYREYIVQGV